MVPSNPLLGAGLHAVGAMAAAFCYMPQQKLRGWSWQTYWLSQALVCWVVAPIVGVILTIPHLTEVLHEAPKDAMLITFTLGVAYGIGGTAFGLAIRHIGYSLTYAHCHRYLLCFGNICRPYHSPTDWPDHRQTGIAVGILRRGRWGLGNNDVWCCRST